MATPTQVMMSDIIDAIQKQVESGTFTLEAVKRIEELRVAYQASVTQTETLTRDLTDFRGRLTATNADLEALRKTCGALERRETAVRTAEIQIAVDKKELELTKVFKDDMKTLLHTALRSPIVQTMMKDQMPSTYSSSPGCMNTTPMPVDKSTVQQEI